VRALLAAAAIVCSTACGGQHSLTSPTEEQTSAPVQATLSLTVRVLETQTERAIPRASVFLDNQPVGQTGDDGTLITETVSGREVTVHATADGYRQSVIVAATPNAGERWTFFLEAR
jgi:hypothetical protein